MELAGAFQHGARLLAGILLLATATAVRSSGHLPIIDLDYQLHQASFFNDTAGYYNFSNVRYAAPPIGALRFAAPQPPSIDRSIIHTGTVGHICPQANPAWFIGIDQRNNTRNTNGICFGIQYRDIESLFLRIGCDIAQAEDRQGKIVVTLFDIIIL